MDLGSTVCTPKSPKCEACPLNESCSAFLLGKQENFPVKKQKKESPVEEHTILKIYLGDKILVRKRPSTGLLAGLYELIDLPGTMTNKQVQEWLMENFPPLAGAKEGPDIRPLGRGRHIFSHLRWEMLGYEIHLPSLSAKKQKDLSACACRLGEPVPPDEYDKLAFASALRAYR
jgi:A/G-specific adenine glycosylase